jgi:hypothetical protein
MSENPYDAMMPPGPLARAVDKAVDEANAAFLADPDAQAATALDAERWTAIMEAESVVGEHGVVFPVATARAVVKVLRGEDVGMNRELLARVIEGYLNRGVA